MTTAALPPAFSFSAGLVLTNQRKPHVGRGMRRWPQAPGGAIYAVVQSCPALDRREVGRLQRDRPRRADVGASGPLEGTVGSVMPRRGVSRSRRGMGNPCERGRWGPPGPLHWLLRVVPGSQPPWPRAGRPPTAGHALCPGSEQHPQGPGVYSENHNLSKYAGGGRWDREVVRRHRLLAPPLPSLRPRVTMRRGARRRELASEFTD